MVAGADARPHAREDARKRRIKKAYLSEVSNIPDLPKLFKASSPWGMQ
jgi:hypothetical protein